MLEIDHNRLSEDQKRLVSAFNAAAQYFKDRLLGKVKISTEHEPLPDLTHNRTGEQANSKIAEEAMEIFRQHSAFEKQSYFNAIKTGGTTDSLGQYFLEEVQIVKNSDDKTRIAEAAYRKILTELLVASMTEQALPIEYIQGQLKRLGFGPSN
ncbi:MAG: hypothetical protein R3D88_04440 [Alphaproteobacteria bacterium]|nr:hypothetical protein [Alphaproteobacteria bacterium]